jgi:hypothetical protein
MGRDVNFGALSPIRPVGGTLITKQTEHGRLAALEREVKLNIYLTPELDGLLVPW